MSSIASGRVARLIAHYLPQFHPIPENSEWWGEGFTEWDNVRRAQPLFESHLQPRIPGELGYYDLRSRDTRAAQAQLARDYGVEAFCYWHYWFAGRRLLERPFNDVLASGEPDFPFCLGWANHTWTASWVGRPWQVLVDQTYPGRADYEAHFAYVQQAFSDARYVTVDGKPLFYIFRPRRIPNPLEFTDLWRELAHRAGFKGIFFVGSIDDGEDPRALGLDGGVDHGALRRVPRWLAVRQSVESALKGRRMAVGHQRIARFQRPAGPLRMVHDLATSRLGLPLVHRYDDATVVDIKQGIPSSQFPCAMPNWDNTPRMGRWGYVLHDATPETWHHNLRLAIASVKDRPLEKRLVFVKSWNEWAEGNYLEPDAHHGRGFLEATRRAVFDSDRAL